MNAQKKEPLTKDNYAVELVDTETKRTRTLAVPPGLTHEEAVEWTQQWLGKNERIAQFVEYN